MAGNVRVKMKGMSIVLSRFRSAVPAISQAQQRAGMSVANRLKLEAQNIIQNSAPRSRGTLRESLYITQNQLSKGWKTVLRTDLPYAGKVEGGAPAEKIAVNPNLVDWANRVLGPRASKAISRKKFIVVRKGNNPRYSTEMGMRFFQTPVESSASTISAEYNKEIERALLSR